MTLSNTILLHDAIAGLLIFAAVRDVATRTVPNWVSVALLAVGIALQAVAGNLPAAALAGIVVFAAAALMWRQGWLGGADVKLLGAGAVTVAPGSVENFLLAIALTGGGLALLYLGLSLVVRRPKNGPRKTFLSRILKAEAWRIHNRGPIPYAAAIAAGGLFTLIQG